MQSSAPTSPEITENSTSLQATFLRWLPALITVLFIAGVLRSLLASFQSGVPWMVYEEDDFFYYLKVAQNLAHGAGSTFNGIVPTNGYHPLWLVVLTVFSFLTTNPHHVMVFLSACIFIATLATYFLSRAIIRRSGINDVLATALAIYVALYSLHIFAGGMEIILTVPLLLALLVLLEDVPFWSRGLFPAASVGLLASAMILSRLDSIILAALLGAALVLHPVTRRALTPRVLAGIGLGLLPVALYFLSNQVIFHTWLPVSGMAKQLKFDHSFSSPAISSLLGKTPLQLVSALIGPLALLVLPLLWKRLDAVQQATYPVVILFPFLYVAILSTRSDWKIWDWYFYSFRVSLCVTLTILCMLPPVRFTAWLRAGGAVLAIAMIVLTFRTRTSTGDRRAIYETAKDIQQFATTHPGIYAMGDRSGMVAYLTTVPIVQTEGLVMDRDFLHEIQQQTPLRSVLAKYNVRYFIATDYPPYPNGCVRVSEPHQAGTNSPHMIGIFCETPVAVWQRRDNRTLIFDLDRSLSVNRP
ncbi:MAG TPA: hypothetical protein VIM62_12105 [Acidobacteriaceae bacterium]